MQKHNNYKQTALLWVLLWYVVMFPDPCKSVDLTVFHKWIVGQAVVMLSRQTGYKALLEAGSVSHNRCKLSPRRLELNCPGFPAFKCHVRFFRRRGKSVASKLPPWRSLVLAWVKQIWNMPLLFPLKCFETCFEWGVAYASKPDMDEEWIIWKSHDHDGLQSIVTLWGDFNDAKRNLRGERFRVMVAETSQAICITWYPALSLSILGVVVLLPLKWRLWNVKRQTMHLAVFMLSGADHCATLIQDSKWDLNGTLQFRKNSSQAEKCWSIWAWTLAIDFNSLPVGCYIFVGTVASLPVFLCIFWICWFNIKQVSKQAGKQAQRNKQASKQAR